jgi:hypothetical protein
MKVKSAVMEGEIRRKKIEINNGRIYLSIFIPVAPTWSIGHP